MARRSARTGTFFFTKPAAVS